MGLSRKGDSLLKGPTCESCPYWEDMSSSDWDGRCHFDPIVIDKGRHDFCGQHPDYPVYIVNLKTVKMNNIIKEVMR